MSSPVNQPQVPELPQLQAWFQAVITHAEGIEQGVRSDAAQRLMELSPTELERVITRSKALTAEQRLAIYANAYHSRLLECLGEVFPILKRTLGEDGFHGLAFGYLQDYPSRTYTLNELGRHFPRYLQQTRPQSHELEGDLIDPATVDEPAPIGNDWPDFLIDLAKLEWGIYEVFDGPGVEGIPLLGPEQLSGITPEQWPHMKLATVPCLQLLTTRFPVNDYYTALKRAKSDEAIAIPAPAESFVALTRRDFVVRRYNLTHVEFELLQALQHGHSIEQAVGAILPLVKGDLDQLARNLQEWFRAWTADGFFQSVS